MKIDALNPNVDPPPDVKWAILTLLEFLQETLRASSDSSTTDLVLLAMRNHYEACCAADPEWGREVDTKCKEFWPTVQSVGVEWLVKRFREKRKEN